MDLLTALGLLVALRAIVYQVVWGQTVSGWASLIAIVAVLGGAQLLALSLIGEYIARIYVHAQNRPTFLVAELLEHPSLAAASDDAPASLDLRSQLVVREITPEAALRHRPEST